jgi:uncharacterized protein
MKTENKNAQASISKIVTLVIVVLTVVIVLLFFSKFNILNNFINFIPDFWFFDQDKNEKDNPSILFPIIEDGNTFKFSGGKTSGEGSERPPDKNEKYKRYTGFIPEPISWVSDYRDVIQENYEENLNNLLSEIEKESSVEIAIISFSSNEKDESFKEIAFAIFNKWGIGKKEKDNGILIFFSIDNDYSRIQMGQGAITGIFPDGRVGELIDKHLKGNLNKDEVDSALLNLIKEIRNILHNEYLGE